MKKEIPNQHLADRIAGKVDLYGKSLIEKKEAVKEESKQEEKIEKKATKGKKK